MQVQDKCYGLDESLIGAHVIWEQCKRDPKIPEFLNQQSLECDDCWNISFNYYCNNLS